MQGSSSLKRKRPDGVASLESLTKEEHALYNVIRSRKDMGIWSKDLKQETNLPDTVVKRALTSLQQKKLVKEVVNCHNKAKKHYMASEFEPSKEITGGDWYSDGNLDTEFIGVVKKVCLRHILAQNVATLDGILEWIKKGKFFSVDLSSHQIEQILRALVLDDEIVEMKSTGFGDFSSVPVGRVCYRCKKKNKGEPKIGAMASIPCGVCPRISACTPEGIISPKTCVYYQKWLDF
ncbi:DNA-directed RNA polymerase III subunit rpc6 [Neltuma alba]|uniref:DNA-directed RNA polymerase III subunit rpc6 n=1 Tax=Neltuma alba TaxID=207710 RepID=UPI0010A5203D|nr:DNA-directed RNA polymerase III subunit rpc6 [Prosopis alba]XP_028782837.1 DNA-directed RNA polymerase III subunit rpc6 [Prosopis alba]XP_028782842.1 DNA-directed RNA polymerase III subunit rpc6 [Prosopis alba]